MLGRLVLRQEDTLNQLGLDRSLMMFIQCGKGSLMPHLLEQAKNWNALRQSGDASTSLRQTMFQAVFSELIHRASKLNLEQRDDALVQGLKAKSILTEPQMAVPVLESSGQGQTSLHEIATLILTARKKEVRYLLIFTN